MKALKRKLILSIISLVATIICLTSTTYAWFARNENAWTDDFTINMGANDNLSISVDGVKFSNQLTTDDITRAIVAKRLNKNINDLKDEEINNNKSMDLRAVSTNNLVNFTTVDNSCAKLNGFYVPKTASNYDYISFDIYFRVEGDSNPLYKLSLVGEERNKHDGLNGATYIKNNIGPQTIKLTNSLTLADGTVKNSKDELVVNPLNALRMGFISDDTENNNVVIYEPYMGLGSYALANEDNNIYNPDRNAMLTYFNNINNDTKLSPLANLDVYKNTEKNFDNEVSLGKFVSTNGSYNVVKITCAIWLEGYDADYFYGVKANDFTFFLNFVKIDLGGNE